MIFLALLLVLVPAMATATTLTAASCSYADVNTQVSAASSGDTVVIPAGTCTWTTTLQPSSKYITIQGAGVDQTIIVDGVNKDNTPLQRQVINWTTIAGGISRISGITFQGNQGFSITSLTRTGSTANVTTATAHGLTAGVSYIYVEGQAATVHQNYRGTFLVDSTPTATSLTYTMASDPGSNGSGTITGYQADAGSNNGMVRVDGVSPWFRIDNVKFILTTASAFQVYGYVRGVMDSWTLNADTSAYSTVLYVLHDTWSDATSRYGDKSWATASTMGTAQAFFFENGTCTFDDPFGTVFVYRYCLDGWAGSRVVWRNNTTRNMVINNHGTESGGRNQGWRQGEFYNNTSTWNNGAHPSAAFGSRGGVNLVYNNTITTSGGAIVDASYNMTYFRVSVHSDVGYPWGYCDSQTISAGNLTSSGTTATLAIAKPNGIIANVAGVYFTIAGANEANYNGTFTASSSSGCDNTGCSSISYTMPGTATSPATGTILAKMPWDGHADSTGYPCIGQTGRGAGDLLSGDDGTVPVGPAPVGWPNQVSDPDYIWNNTIDGVVSAGVSATASVIVENRDFFNGTARPGWSAYTYPHPLTCGNTNDTPCGTSTVAPRGRPRWHGPHAKPDRMEIP